jgi:hypothetical protein
MKIPTQTCKFIQASGLFKRLNKLWDEFSESNPAFTWGSNNRSLVVAEAILNHLDGCAIDNERQLETLRKRIADLPEGGQTYVDLED